LQDIERFVETIQSCHTLRNTLQIVTISLPPSTKYFTALNNECGGYRDKTERVILRDHLHSKLTCLCMSLGANIISTYRKSVKCSDFIFSSQVIRLFILRSPLIISFVRSASLPTISVFPPSIYDIHRRIVEAICRHKTQMT